MVTEKHVAVAIRERVRRSGYSLRPGFEGGQMPLFRKLPQRGFNRTRFQSPCAVVNLSDLSQISGDIVSIESLKEAGLIRSNSKAAKLLGNGSIDKAYKVKLSNCSKSAREKIEAAGGSVEETNKKCSLLLLIR